MGYLGGVAWLEQLKGGCVRASEGGRKLDGRFLRMKCVASCQEGHFGHV